MSGEPPPHEELGCHPCLHPEPPPQPLPLLPRAATLLVARELCLFWMRPEAGWCSGEEGERVWKLLGPSKARTGPEQSGGGGMGPRGQALSGPPASPSLSLTHTHSLSLLHTQFLSHSLSPFCLWEALQVQGPLSSASRPQVLRFSDNRAVRCLFCYSSL